jgi:uncharacterized membrane protein
MVEYSVVTWVLMVGLVLGSTVKIVPQGRTRKNMIELFLDGYQAYYDSVFYMLSLPFP